MTILIHHSEFKSDHNTFCYHQIMTEFLMITLYLHKIMALRDVVAFSMIDRYHRFEELVCPFSGKDMQAVGFSKMLAPICQTTQYHV
jgi:hypothetical protein